MLEWKLCRFVAGKEGFCNTALPSSPFSFYRTQLETWFWIFQDTIFRVSNDFSFWALFNKCLASEVLFITSNMKRIMANSLNFAFFDNLPTTIFFSAIPHRVIDAFHSDWLDYSAKFWSRRYIAESESRNLKENMPLKEIILGAGTFSVGHWN